MSKAIKKENRAPAKSNSTEQTLKILKMNAEVSQKLYEDALKVVNETSD